MQIDILTLFPEICRGPLGESMMKRAQDNKIVDIRIHNLRDWTTDKHRIVDDAPFGGGQGMVMKPEPIFAAVEELRNAIQKTPNPPSPGTGSAVASAQRLSEPRSPSRRPTPLRAGALSEPEANVQLPRAKVILMSPTGRRLDQKMALQLSGESNLIIICGHYEGVDYRVVEHLVDLEISIGDYVLTNGAVAAVVFVDAIVRLLPGALGHDQSAADDSFSEGLLEGPQYTRPAEFRGWKVPKVLLSGNHAEIATWRKEQAMKRTREGRPDLLDK